MQLIIYQIRRYITKAKTPMNCPFTILTTIHSNYITA